MSMSLSASYYADTAVQRTVCVVENAQLAQDTYRLRFECPEMARRILPGQFLMLRLSGFDDPLIGRPLALYDTVTAAPGEVSGIDVVYLVKGKLTSRLVHLLPGQEVDVWGPLGNGFEPVEVEHLIMVAGGIGQTPFVALARETLGMRRYGQPARPVTPARKVTLCYGARSAGFLAGVPDFEACGVEVRLSTDDGTRGHHGLVTEVLDRVLQETRWAPHIVCCGPEPMMAEVARMAAQRSVPCRVSLETPMACGIGICFTCVAKVRDQQGRWDYKRTCVEGPVFEAALIDWS